MSLSHREPPPVVAVKRATSVIPIVFAAVGDPVGTGLVTSLARPGGNATGLSIQATDRAGKRLELLTIVAEQLQLAAEMMRADAGLHADKARRQIGEPCFHLSARPFLSQHDRTAPIMAHDVKRVLADIDADHGDCAVEFLRNGVLLDFAAPGASFACWRGPEHGRTISLAMLAISMQRTRPIPT
jgi:ABC transporter substrate binding protein